MPAEIEVPTEHLHEHVHHEAHHSHEKWLTWVALTTAILAVFAAVSALLAGYHVNKSVIEQVQASDMWSEYQSNSIKEALITSKIDLCKILDKPVLKDDQAKQQKYKDTKADLMPKAKRLQESGHEHFERHEWLAYAVTVFQVSIAIAAIAAVMKMRPMWYLSMACGLLGIGFLIYPHVVNVEGNESKEEEHAKKPAAVAVFDQSDWHVALSISPTIRAT